ncbi:hypothetical protein ACEWY4_008909 [Coilia grayii]|uniref:ZZ-type domain-containing protein n=1 Tax=Coilia grayii TaxID=363190 RepID=A0ABD1K4X7_9TELE
MKLSTVAAVCPKPEPQDLTSEVSGSTSVVGSEVMDVLEVIHTLGVLYEQQEEESGQQLDILLCVDMCLNWLLNVYDRGRVGKVRVLSFKTGLVSLCNADIKDKCKLCGLVLGRGAAGADLFQQVCGGDGRSDGPHLAALLTELMLVPHQLGEVAAFGGSNVEPSLASCFRMVPGKASVGLADFLEWMALEPQSVVWLGLLQRVGQAESTLHQARCSICKDSPMQGFRYRSLKQFNVDICQSCFLSGQALKGKTLHYPIIEYYTPSTSGEKMRDFAETLKNKFRSKQYFSRHPQRGYLPVQAAMGTGRDSTLAQMEHQNCSFFNHSLDEDQYPLGSGAEMEHPHLLREMEHPHLLREMEHPHLLREMEHPHLLREMDPSHLLSCTGRESQEELQQTIAILEDQNRILQREYRRLRWQHAEAEQAAFRMCEGGGPAESGVPPGEPSGGQDEALLVEARVLKQHRGRLETRMQILQEHNQQLESQLHRLRALLKTLSSSQRRDDSEDSESSGSRSAVSSPSLRRGYLGGRSAVSSPSLRRGYLGGAPRTDAPLDNQAAEHDQDKQESDTTYNLYQVIEQLRTAFPSEADMGDSGRANGDLGVCRTRHKATPGEIRRMCPQQRARHMAYHEPHKEVQNEMAASRQRVCARLAALKMREGSVKNAREAEKQRQDRVTLQLGAAEAQIRMRLARLRRQQVMAREIDMLVCYQPTAWKAIRIESLLPKEAQTGFSSARKKPQVRRQIQTAPLLFSLKW